METIKGPATELARRRAAQEGMTMQDTERPQPVANETLADAERRARHLAALPQQKPGEIGGREGPEPTRYGDWELKGRCSDF